MKLKKFKAILSLSLTVSLCSTRNFKFCCIYVREQDGDPLIILPIPFSMDIHGMKFQPRSQVRQSDITPRWLYSWGILDQ